MRKYLATSERYHSDEIDNQFTLKDENLTYGDTFSFDGLEWHITEVGELCGENHINIVAKAGRCKYE